MRSVAWVNLPTQNVKDNIEKIINSQIKLYIVRENGPTSFILKEEDKKKLFRVQIGGLNKCSCHSKNVCRHLLFVMIRVYRIPKENPIVWQKGLIDSEINKILNGRMRQVKKQIFSPKKNNEEEEEEINPIQKTIEKGDVCPICYESIYKEASIFLSFCKGCGNNIHVKCMKIWMKHRENNNENINCPLCRNIWEYQDVQDLKRRNLSSYCDYCKKKIPYKKVKFKCNKCEDFNLCKKCFNNQIHSQHSFKFYSKFYGIWKIVKRKQRYTAPANNELFSLQFKDIDENDYSILLDGLKDVNLQKGVERALLQLIRTIEINDENLYKYENIECPICLMNFELHENIKILPGCNHIFHDNCIDKWLAEHNNTCPLCKNEVFPPKKDSITIKKKKKKKKLLSDTTANVSHRNKKKSSKKLLIMGNNINQSLNNNINFNQLGISINNQIKKINKHGLSIMKKNFIIPTKRKDSYQQGLGLNNMDFLNVVSTKSKVPQVLKVPKNNKPVITTPQKLNKIKQIERKIKENNYTNNPNNFQFFNELFNFQNKSTTPSSPNSSSTRKFKFGIKRRNTTNSLINKKKKENKFGSNDFIDLLNVQSATNNKVIPQKKKINRLNEKIYPKSYSSFLIKKNVNNKKQTLPKPVTINTTKQKNVNIFGNKNLGVSGGRNKLGVLNEIKKMKQKKKKKASLFKKPKIKAKPLISNVFKKENNPILQLQVNKI